MAVVSPATHRHPIPQRASLALTLFSLSLAPACSTLASASRPSALTRLSEISSDTQVKRAQTRVAASVTELVLESTSEVPAVSRYAIQRLVAADEVTTLHSLLTIGNATTRALVIAELSPAQVRLLAGELQQYSGLPEISALHHAATVRLASIGAESSQRSLIRYVAQRKQASSEERRGIVAELSRGLTPDLLGRHLSDIRTAGEFVVLNDVVAQRPDEFDPLLREWLRFGDRHQRMFAVISLLSREGAISETEVGEILDARDELFGPLAFRALLPYGHLPPVAARLNRYLHTAPMDTTPLLLSMVYDCPTPCLSDSLLRSFQLASSEDERLPWARALGGIGHPAVLPYTFELIGRGEADTGWGLLSSCRSPEVLSFAISCLGGEHAGYAREYVVGFGRDALPMIRPLLETAQPPLQLEAALIMGRLGDASVASRLYRELFPGGEGHSTRVIAESLAPCMTIEVTEMIAAQIRQTRFFSQFGELLSVMEPASALVLIRRYIAPVLEMKLLEVPQLRLPLETVLGMEAMLWDPGESPTTGLMRMLGACGEVALPSLCRLLRHPNPRVAGRAAWAIGEVGDTWALPALAQAAARASGEVLCRTNLARGRLKDVAVIPDLIHYVEDDVEGLGVFAAEYLASIPDARADLCLNAQIAAGNHLPNILSGLRRELCRGVIRAPLLTVARTQLSRVDTETARVLCDNAERFRNQPAAEELFTRLFVSPEREVRTWVDGEVKRLTSTPAGRGRFLSYLRPVAESESFETSRNLAIQYLSLFERAESAGIHFPLRFREKTLETLIFCRQQRRPIDMPLATLIFNRNDHNGVFAQSSQVIVDELLRNGVWVDYYEVSSVAEFEAAIRRSGGVEHGAHSQIDLVVIAAHGFADGVVVGVDDSGNDIAIRIGDIEALRGSDMWRGFAEGFQGLLFACSTGRGKDHQKNFANTLAEVATGEGGFIAPTIAAFGIDRLQVVRTQISEILTRFNGRSRLRLVEVEFGRVSEEGEYWVRR